MAEEKYKAGDTKKRCRLKCQRFKDLVRLISESSEPLIPVTAQPENRAFYEQAIVPDRPYVFT